MSKPHWRFSLPEPSPKGTRPPRAPRMYWARLV